MIENKEYIRDKLIELGYRPVEYGDHFRMNAVYRHGKTSSSLAVNCKTGRFVDYGNNLSGDFKALIKLTMGDISDEDLLLMTGALSNADGERITENLRIKMEKTYDKEILDRLLPHYNFYIDRGIKEETLKIYKCGFASGGDLNRRIVFPIFRRDGAIHGFSGRHISWKEGSPFPKWKHKGVKSGWVYPLYLSDGQIRLIDHVENKKQIIIVESIGDSMALLQNGYPENMVTFGLDLSPKQKTFLLTLDVDRIIIAQNNDNNKKINSGAISSIKMFLDLLGIVDSDKLKIALPLKNDFFEMLQDGEEAYNNWYDKIPNFDIKKTSEYILKLLKRDGDMKIFKKRHHSKINLLKQLCQEI